MRFLLPDTSKNLLREQISTTLPNAKLAQARSPLTYLTDMSREFAVGLLALRSLVTVFRSVLLIVAWFAFIPLGQADEPKAPSPPTLLVLGDSLSAAHGISPTQGWVSLLAQRLPTWKVVNASVSGETSSGGRSRLPSLLARHTPRVVILELGANDGLRGLPLSSTRQNLQAMIDAVRQSGAKLLLVGIMLPPNYGAQYSMPFAQLYRELAEHNTLPLVPFLLEGVATDPSLMQADGLHPNASAQPRILQNVWPALAPLL